MYYTNVLQWLEASADKAPQKAAFADPQGEITFADLVERARGIGGILMKKTGIGEPVAFYMEKSVEAVCGMFGAVYAGGFYSFIDVRQPVPRAQKILDVLRPRVLITDEKNCAKARELHFQGEILDIHQLIAAADPADKSEEELRAEEAALRSIRREMTDGLPLYVNFTSGSTGLPKGVAVSHRSVIEFISHFADGFGIREDDVIANQAPFDFDVSVKDIYSGLLTGAKVQIIPREYFSAPTQLMDYLSDKKVTVLIWAVSAMCFVSIMNGLAYKTPSTVRLVMFSGEVMPIKQLNKWRQYLPGAVYVNLYGPTEITCNCTYYVLKKDHEYALTDVIPAGKAFPNEKVFLLDEEDHEVTPDQPGKEGEICVCGTSVALGYYRDPERTKAAFMQNPLNTDYEERMYRTGDIGRYDSDGNIVYVSRRDFQIKHLGHRIELGEIEADAMSRDGVSRACCIYDRDKKRLILFYTGEREKKDLEAELKEALPPFMFPNRVIQLSDMPLNKNGKIDRHALEDVYHQK